MTKLKKILLLVTASVMILAIHFMQTDFRKGTCIYTSESESIFQVGKYTYTYEGTFQEGKTYTLEMFGFDDTNPCNDIINKVR